MNNFLVLIFILKVSFLRFALEKALASYKAIKAFFTRAREGGKYIDKSGAFLYTRHINFSKRVGMYAIIEYKGNQYKAQKGDIIIVNNLDEKEGTKLDISTVLMVSDGDNTKIGAPYVEGSKVSVTVGESFRDKKVLVLKYKSKKDYHRLIGYRASYTKLIINDIQVS